MQNTRNLVILFLTLVIMLLGFGIIIPILPDMVVGFGGGGVAMGLLMAIYSAMQFLFSPMWGTLSDRFGRKPILMIGMFGYALAIFHLLIFPVGTAAGFVMLMALMGLQDIGSVISHSV